VDYSLTPAKSDKQFKRAQELKAMHSIKLERNQAGELLAKMKALRTREETVVPLAEAAARLREGKGACREANEPDPRAGC
jgi:hypothetical protein